jgi:hypothetical protein
MNKLTASAITVVIVASIAVFALLTINTKSGGQSMLNSIAAAETYKLDNLFKVDSGADAGRKVAVYDGTIEKYNGYYYLAGTGSSGKVYRSKDMKHWETSYPFVPGGKLPSYAEKDYTEYGASDLYFHNGVLFYGFNGINLLFGNPATMNAKPDFRPFAKKFDDGIDVQFMVAPTGDLLYIRKVNPNEPDPNTGAPKPGRSGAWMWKVDSFFDEKGNTGRSAAKELLYSQPGFWSNLNHANFEGPEMVYHQGQYYLLYASNQMFPETGLYQIGAAQAAQADAFDNSTKYPAPLVARNIEKLLLNYNVILPTAEHGSQEYAYTFTDPGEGWTGLPYDSFKWNRGEGGFGWPTTNVSRIPTIYNGGASDPNHIWSAPNGPEKIWVRRTFALNDIPKTVVLRHRLQGQGKIYINGKEVLSVSANNRAYSFVQIPTDMLKMGENVIAAEAVKTGSANHLDFGLYDTNGEPVEADIVGPGQPNVIEGPNGFETWITYKAFWNSNNGQGKDRVYFWGDEMVADGPTSKDSPGLHFDAWSPTLQDDLDTEASLNLFEKIPDGVSIRQQSLYFDRSGVNKEVLFKDKQLANFYLETNVHFEDSDAGDSGSGRRAGVTVWYRDEQNHVRLWIDRDRRTYITDVTMNGETTATKHDLPPTFQFQSQDERVKDFGEQFHSLRVYKNGSKLFAELDHYDLNNDRPVLELKEMSDAGGMGLVCGGSACRMDNVTLTAGWSESNGDFTGWDSAWQVTDQGLVSSDTGPAFTVKGDPVKEHEFSVNIVADSLPETGKAGIVLEYVDEQNYVAAYTNYANQSQEVHRVAGGKDTLIASAPAARDTMYGYSNYDGKTQDQYVYHLRGTAEVSQARILWTSGTFDYLRTIFSLPDTTSPYFGFDSWNAKEQQWEPIPINYLDKGKGAYHVAKFASPVRADRIRLRVPAENNRPFSFAIRENISTQNFMKSVRKDGVLYVWENNELKFTVKDPFEGQPARFGLLADHAAAAFNSFTGFEIK